MRYPSEIPPNTRIGIALSCVDFLPTLNGVLNLQISRFSTGEMPPNGSVETLLQVGTISLFFEAVGRELALCGVGTLQVGGFQW